jgi:hypothetical protein
MGERLMIKKIISGGQTGVDQAALDAAIKQGIPHGGWVPKGRITENGVLPDKYNMREMPTSSYAERTEQNVMDADGTLIISRGKLTEGSELTRKLAMKHNRPWLHIDLNKKPKYHASTIIISWIDEHNIETLNVAGPRASKDPEIYLDVLSIIETVSYLALINEGTPSSYVSDLQDMGHSYTPPQSVPEAVDHLMAEMSLKIRTTIANMTEVEIANLNATLGKYIRNKFGLSAGNTELIISCRSASKQQLSHEEEVSGFLIKQLWQKLRKTHKLRVVK